LSSRRKGSFIKVNCAAIPASLLESELFGHEKGSFTGALAQRIGRFELAHQGTLFLDEIGEMPLELQPKLLRAIQDQEFERLGGTRTIRTDVRFVAATNRDLKAMVGQERFREDLYFRLNALQLVVPPLRERPEDIPPLIDHFVGHWNRELGRTVKGPSDEALTLLLAYRWPGNVRELRNVIERAILLESEEWILPEHLPLEIVGAGGSGAAVIGTMIRTEKSIVPLADAERMAIELALEQTAGNKTRAAEALGISRQTLRTKLKEYRIDTPGGHGA